VFKTVGAPFGALSKLQLLKCGAEQLLSVVLGLFSAIWNIFFGNFVSPNELVRYLKTFNG
jgi:hypothetical protein